VQPHVGGPDPTGDDLCRLDTDGYLRWGSDRVRAQQRRACNPRDRATPSGGAGGIGPPNRSAATSYRLHSTEPTTTDHVRGHARWAGHLQPTTRVIGRFTLPSARQEVVGGSARGRGIWRDCPSQRELRGNRAGAPAADPQPAGCGTDTAGGCSTRVVGGTLDAKSLTGSACGRATNASHPQEWNSLSAR